MTFKRIVSLSPSVTEILILLNSGREIIGVTDQCARMEQVKNKEKVGSFICPDTEKVISLKPDLVIVYKKIRDERLLTELTKRNITILNFAPIKIKEIFDGIKRMGDVVGSGKLAKIFINQSRKRIDAVKEKVSGRALPRVLRLMRGIPITVPITVPSPCSYQYDAVIAAGGRPMFSAAKEARAQVSFEDVIRFDPQIIVRCERERPVPRMAVGVVKNWEGWDNISAVKTGKIFSLPCRLSCRPGSGIVDCIEKMAGFFHEEAF